MPRRKLINTDEPITPPIISPESLTADADAPIRRRRRRRTAPIPAPDYTQETTLLVEATLKSRGAKGAKPDILQNVVNWARGIRSEGDELRLLAARPRRPKTPAPNDRLARYEVNRALLDGVLSGTIILDAQEEGELTFVHAAYGSECLRFGSAPAGLPTLPAASEEDLP